jgi:hypothetical protein
MSYYSRTETIETLGSVFVPVISCTPSLELSQQYSQQPNPYQTSSACTSTGCKLSRNYLGSPEDAERNSFTPQELSAKIIANAEQIDISELPTGDRNRFRSFLYYYLNHGRSTDSSTAHQWFRFANSPQDEDTCENWKEAYTSYLTEYFEILGQMFFFGLLKHANDQFIVSWEPQSIIRSCTEFSHCCTGPQSLDCPAQMRELGHTTPVDETGRPKSLGNPASVRIVICVGEVENHLLEFRDHQERLDLDLGTLVHEMVHAMFMKYSCSCKENCASETVKREQLGSCGHGLAWENAASAVEDVCKKLLGRPNFDMGVEETVYLDNMPENVDINGMGKSPVQG